jgi:sRNA-binding protein
MHVKNYAVIKMLCDRFPQAFSMESRNRQPLKLGVHVDALAALEGRISARQLHSALRAYTSGASYLRALSTGACRLGLDGKPAGTVIPEEEAVAKRRLADLAKRIPPASESSQSPVTPTRVEACSITTSKTEAPAAWPAPKRLSLADLREAGRRRREAALTASLASVRVGLR